MMPTTSPRLTSKDTSFRAQKSSREEVVVDGSWKLGTHFSIFDLLSEPSALQSQRRSSIFLSANAERARSLFRPERPEVRRSADRANGGENSACRGFRLG